MGEHQRTLQVLQILRGDARLRQQTKTGIDTVGRAPLGDDIVHAVDAGINTVNRAAIKTQLHWLLPDGAKLRKTQMTRR